MHGIGCPHTGLRTVQSGIIPEESDGQKAYRTSCSQPSAKYVVEPALSKAVHYVMQSALSKDAWCVLLIPFLEAYPTRETPRNIEA